MVVDQMCSLESGELGQKQVQEVQLNQMGHTSIWVVQLELCVWARILDYD